jgi:hypothetical protein
MDTRLVSDSTQPTHAAYWTKLTIGALFLIATSEFFLAQIIAQLAWPGYSVSQYDISALGVTACGPYINAAAGTSFLQKRARKPRLSSAG